MKKRGPKPLAVKEKKLQVYFMVKTKHKAKFTKAVENILQTEFAD